jgi:AraC family transcriptional regulator
MSVQTFSPVTLGARLKSVTACDLVLTETTHLPNQQLPRHSHELTNIAFVLDGSFTEFVTGHAMECQRHSLLIKPAGESHANRYGDKGMRCLLVEIPPARISAMGKWARTLDQIRHVRGATLTTLAMRIFKEFRVMDEASPLAIEGLILELVADLSRKREPRSERKTAPWLERARDMLHGGLSETISLSEVAKTVEVHPVHLAREFRRVYGCTLGEYLRCIRIEFCCRQLSSSDIPLVQIALAAGFSNQSHFCRVFKRQTGTTPREFRLLSRLSR